MIRHAPTPTTKNPGVVIAGSDLDPSLVTKLTQGDKLMVEVNGTRYYSKQPCPLAAEQPWTVVSNDAPTLGQTPNEGHQLVISHPKVSEPLVLRYRNLLRLDPNQPAVFHEKHNSISLNADGTSNPIYVILQFVAYGMKAKELDECFEPHDVASARMLLEDEDFRAALLYEWTEAFAGFKPGWKQKSVFRFSQRAMVYPDVIDAFVRADWDRIKSLDLATLLRIHASLHWLPHFLCQSPLAVERATVGDESDVSSKGC